MRDAISQVVKYFRCDEVGFELTVAPVVLTKEEMTCVLERITRRDAPLPSIATAEGAPSPNAKPIEKSRKEKRKPAPVFQTTPKKQKVQTTPKKRKARASFVDTREVEAIEKDADYEPPEEDSVTSGD